jgi:hypothetical protein
VPLPNRSAKSRQSLTVDKIKKTLRWAAWSFMPILPLLNRCLAYTVAKSGPGLGGFSTNNACLPIALTKETPCRPFSEYLQFWALALRLQRLGSLFFRIMSPGLYRRHSARRLFRLLSLLFGKIPCLATAQKQGLFQYTLRSQCHHPCHMEVWRVMFIKIHSNDNSDRKKQPDRASGGYPSLRGAVKPSTPSPRSGSIPTGVPD